MVPYLTAARATAATVFDTDVQVTWDEHGDSDDIRDPETGALTPPTGDSVVVWAGKILLRPDRQTRRTAGQRTAGQSLTDNDYRARFPAAAPPIPLAAVLTVIASASRPRLAGQTMVVTKIEDGSMAVTQLVRLLAQPRGPDT